MSFQGLPQYRCSRCDSVTFNHEGAFVDISVFHTFVSSDAVESVQGVPRRMMHRCPDGCIGIARFCGLMSKEALDQWREAIENAKKARQNAN